MKYFCDSGKKDCTSNTNYRNGGAWGGDSKNKFREVDYFNQYMNSGILEETQQWADKIFNSEEQTYYVAVKMAIKDKRYDFQENTLFIDFSMPNEFLKPVWFLPETKTQGFALNFPTAFHFNHSFSVPVSMNADQAEAFFNKNTTERERKYSTHGINIQGYAVYKVKVAYEKLEQDMSKNFYKPMIRATLKIVSPTVSIFKDSLLKEKIIDLDLSTAKIN